MPMTSAANAPYTAVYRADPATYTPNPAVTSTTPIADVTAPGSNVRAATRWPTANRYSAPTPAAMASSASGTPRTVKRVDGRDPATEVPIAVRPSKITTAKAPTRA